MKSFLGFVQKKIKKRLPSIRITLLVLFAACWLIPISVFSFFIFHSYKEAYIEKIETLIMNGVNVSGVLVSTKIDDGIRLMQKPTYEGYWENAYAKYEKGSITKQDYLAEIKATLKTKFQLDSRFSSYAFYMAEDDNPSFYSSREAYGYGTYLQNVQPLVKEIQNTDSNYVEVHIIDNMIFLVRNLYTVNEYRKYGTLVVSLKTSELFREMPMEKLDQVRIFVNGEATYIGKDVGGTSFASPTFTTEQNQSSQSKRTLEELQILEKIRRVEDLGYKEQVIREEGGQMNGYAFHAKYDNYDLALTYLVDHEDMYASINTLFNLVFIIIGAMIPLIILTYFFLTRHLENPLRRLVKASGKISQGEFGTLLDLRSMPNQEFESFATSFNAMSEQVKYLFDTVFHEQISRRDAQIAALQAQINPHFLNNTLEMMNWQARMNGDITTSKMIEALGTVLDFTMNRNNEKKIYLSEELRCADSYLYIMSMRFGQRLKVEKEVDSSLLQTYVPQLILQPLLENAIKHGIEKISSGTILLKIYQQDETIIIDVENTGKEMSLTELQKIEELLTETMSLPKGHMEPNQHTSIGIANVNKRIKLIYGNEYGLQIFSKEQMKIVSRITLPFDENTREL